MLLGECFVDKIMRSLGGRNIAQKIKEEEFKETCKSLLLCTFAKKGGYRVAKKTNENRQGY